MLDFWIRHTVVWLFCYFEVLVCISPGHAAVSESVPRGIVGIRFSIILNSHTIARVRKDGPAHNAGLLPGDKIVRIEGKSAVGLTPEDVLKLFSGVPGTSIAVSYLRPSTGEIRDLNITRVHGTTSKEEISVYGTNSELQYSHAELWTLYSMEFSYLAKQWRTKKVKEQMPEEARRYKVLAENAIYEKRLDDALDYYEKALELFPLWPEGQFNTAILLGERDFYQDAIRHMRFYTELVPDGPTTAKDKIYIWEEKLRRAKKQKE